MEPVEFALLVEAGPLEAQAVLLCESLRRFGGALARSPITVVSPRASRRPAPATLASLAALDVEYLPLEIASAVPEYGTSFRVHGLARVEARPGPPILVQLDSDTIFVREPGHLARIRGAAARPVDVKGMCTGGPDDPFEDYWRKLSALAGVDHRSLPMVRTSVDQVAVRANFNGGLIAVRRSAGLFARTEEIFARLVASGLGPWEGSGTRIQSGTGLVSEAGSAYWGSSQAAFTLVAAGCGQVVELLPETYNFPLHCLAELAGRIPRGLVHVHYHWLAERDPGPPGGLLDPRLGLPRDVRDWLRAKLPLPGGPPGTP